MLPLHDTDFYTTAARASVTLSAVTVAITGIVALPSLLAFALASVRSARVRAWEARTAEESESTTPSRPQKMALTGKILGEAGSPVVTVTIRQSGREYRVKSGLRHRWTETSRAVDAKAFMLQLASGDEVQVEPGKDVFLVDYLGTVERPAAQERARASILRAGETVHVEGNLVPPLRTGPYRAGGSSFTLRPATGERLLVSVEPLAQRHIDKASFHRKWVFGLTAAIAILHVGIFASYWGDTFLGRVEQIRVEDTRTWTTTNKGHATVHYGVVVKTVNQPAAITEEVSAAAFRELDSADGRHDVFVPMIITPGYGFDALGERPTLSTVACSAAWLAILGLVIAYVASARHQRPWYERDKIIDDGEGPLGEPDSLV